MGWHVCYTALLKDDFCLFVFIVLFKFSWFHVCTCDGNFGGPVGRAFQHRQLSLFYGVYVGVGIHIKYHAVIDGNSDKMGSCRIAEEAAQQRVLRDEE